MTDPDSHKVCRASWYLGNPPRYFLISNTGLSPSRTDFSKSFFYQKILPTVVPQRPPCGGFRLFRFRSPLLTESHVISFPLVTEMFQFTEYPPGAIRYLVILLTQDRIAPFGNQRLVASVGGLTSVFVLIHTSFFGSNCQGIRH